LLCVRAGKNKSMSEFIELKKFIPHYDKELYVVTPWGVRTAIFNRGAFGFRLTDCTHPMQNAYLADHFVCAWTYKNEIDRASILDLVYPNHYERQKEGSQILASVKITKWDKFKEWFTSLRIKGW
jgi:hypothetical protein